MPSGSTTVGVLEDALNEGAETVVGQISNPPANTTITTSTATANITDDDPPGAVVTPLSPCLGGICVTEGIITGVDYTVQLLSDPTNTVTVNISSSADYTRSQTSLTFNPSSAGSNLWNVPQIVTITAFDDGLVETNPEAVTLTHSFVGSLDLAYAGAPVPAPVTINVFDNDSPGVLITETSGSTSVSESGTTDTYSIELSTMPGNGGTNVSVYVQEVSGQCTISLSAPYLISFDNLTWNDPQIITVTAIDDSVIEGAHNCIISHTIDTVGTDDTDYDALTSLATITATITDNDPTAVAVHRSSSSGTNVLRRVLAEQKNTPALCVEFVTFMQLGDRGESVRDIQHFLNKHMGTSILEDGVFGLQTQENVRQFQRQYKVSVDGIVGYQTLLQLNAQYCQRSYCNAVILPTPNLRGTYS
jgi:hypothetical protein